jgi:hypothetical protein
MGAQTRDALQTHGKPFEIAALRPFSMGKAAEETKGVKAQNEDFSEKTLRSLGGGLTSLPIKQCQFCLTNFVFTI